MHVSHKILNIIIKAGYTLIKSILFTFLLFSILPFLVVSESYGIEFTVNPDRIEIAAIPDWVDQNFRWYGEGAIAQSELINAIKYLIDEEIMVIDRPTASSGDSLQSDLAAKGIIVIDSIPRDLAAKGIIVIDSMPDQRATDFSLRGELEAKGIIIVGGMPSDLAAKGIIIINNMPSDSLRDELEAKGIIITGTIPSDVAEKGIIIVGGSPSDLAAKGIIITGTMQRATAAGGEDDFDLDGDVDGFDPDGDVDGFDFLVWQRGSAKSVINDGQLIANQKVQQLVEDGIVGSKTWEIEMSNVKQEINSVHTRIWGDPHLASTDGIVDDLQVIVLFSNSLKMEEKLVQLEISHLKELSDRLEQISDEDMERLEIIKKKFDSIEGAANYMEFKLTSVLITSWSTYASNPNFELKTTDVSSMSKDLQELSDIMTSKHTSKEITSKYQQ